MKLFWRLPLAMAYCQCFLVHVSGNGEDKVRPSALWLDKFYSNVDNIMIEASITPIVSDLPDYVYVPLPTNNTGDSSKPPEERSTPDSTTRPPERDSRKLLQGQNIFLNVLYNKDGISYTNAEPPDTVGDVGTDHYVQMVNGPTTSIVRVLNKNDGSLNKNFELDGLGGVGDCAIGAGDPIVLFDQFASRWFLSEFSSEGDKICVYISMSEDASGAYFRYEFPAVNLPDYPKYGVWHDAYYIGTNENTPAMYALERSQMLNGAVARMVRNAGPPALNGFGFQMLPPLDADGDTPPLGPGLFVRHVDEEAHSNYADNSSRDLFEIYSLSVNFATLTATRTLLQTVQVTEFDSRLCGLSSFSCVAQPGSPTGSPTSLDPLREVVMNRPQYRNFGTHETMVVTWVTDTGSNRHGIRWMELRREDVASSWVVRQQNNFSPDATNRWMSSIAMNKCGDIALGYSVSSLSVSPGIRITGRLSGDPVNQLDVETTLIDGAGSQDCNRWGDYSAMTVDPDDDTTFWYTNEYIRASNGLWATRIVKFTLGNGCEMPSSVPSISSSPSAYPSQIPSASPSSSASPSIVPIASPSKEPSTSSEPSLVPSLTPTASPSEEPSPSPTQPPSPPGPPPKPKPPGKITCGIVRSLLGIC